MAPGAGVSQRTNAVPVREVDVGTVLDQQRDDRLMAGATVGQQDRLEQGRPAELVDMVEVRVGLRQEVPDDLEMAPLGRRDERHASVAVRDRRIRTGFVGQDEDVEEALGTRIEERIETLGVLGVDIRFGIDQHANRLSGSGPSRQHQGRRARRIARVGVRPAG